ncbi:MAG: efflux RND transporter permease subunit [Verrucomicrobiota bacterium]
MASNPVAANLLMLFFIVGGLWTLREIKQEVFPTFAEDTIEFGMRYPGATPEEVEEGILFPAEEAVRGLDVVDRIESVATEGNGKIKIELAEGVDQNRALQEVKNAIDRVSSFPDEAERPHVGLGLKKKPTIDISISGDLDETSLFALAEGVRGDLLASPQITQIDVRGGRQPEIAIEVPQATLRSLGLTLEDIATAIRKAARDVPGGDVRTAGGEVLLRSAGRRVYASEFADIEIVSRSNGGRIQLGEIAEIRDGFVDSNLLQRSNGMPSIRLSVFQTEEQKPLEIAATVEAYVKEKNTALPENVKLEILGNRSNQFGDRIDLLVRNGIAGLTLVLIVLGLFLDPKLAFWVSMGVPVSIVGALVLLPGLNTTINMISLFAFIVTLGMVVDDAVIVGENIFRKMQEGTPRTQAAIEGAREMVVPVLFAVGTNIIAFAPLLFVPGETGRFFAAIPIVVIAVFVVSLVECLFVLPAHLAHAGVSEPKTRGVLFPLLWLQRKTARGFEFFANRVYEPALRGCLNHRYLASAVFLAALMVIGAWYQSGRIKFRFTPSVQSNRVDAEVIVPFGAPFSETVRVAEHIEQAGIRTAKRLGGQELLRGWTTSSGRGGSNTAEVTFDLVAQGQRDFAAADFASIWREEVGDLAGLESLYFDYEIGPAGSKGLTVELSHPDRLTLELAAADLASALESFRGITDVDDGFAAGKPQIDLSLTPEGRSLGLTLEELGQQIRHAYYGAEALRQQRGRDELKVMVRLPAAERQSIGDFESTIIRTPRGGEMPLLQAAELNYGRAYTSINRVDGRRVLRITANVEPKLANANQVRAELEASVLPSLRSAYPGLSFEFGGAQREETEAMKNLMLGLAVSLILIYALLAALFRSFIRGLIVMTCVPFAVAAAFVGHVVMGYDLSVISVFGIIATAGVVVNGGLVLTVTMIECQRSGRSPREAVFEAGIRRFRLIVLTSLTTFFGLAPMIFETSTQARFLVPMAIALGFGTLISSFVVLLFIPATHLILNDVQQLLARINSRTKETSENYNAVIES